MAGDGETGVTIIKLVKELDAGPIAAQESFPVAPDDDAGVVFASAAERRCVSFSTMCSPTRLPAFREQEGEPTYAAKITAERPPARPRPPCARARRPRAGALTAHRCAGRAPRPRRHDLARPRRGRRLLRAGRGAARRRASDDVRRMASRPATVSPARAAAFDVLVRVFEDDAYADRALRTAAADLDERDRALAQRLAFGAVQRVRTLDHAIETLGRRRVAPPRPARASGAPTRRVPARIRRRRRALRRRERVRRARPTCRSRACRRLHERRAPSRSPTGSRRSSTRCRKRRRPRPR